MHRAVAVVCRTESRLDSRPVAMFAIEQFCLSFNPRGMSLPQGEVFLILLQRRTP